MKYKIVLEDGGDWGIYDTIEDAYNFAVDHIHALKLACGDIYIPYDIEEITYVGKKALLSTIKKDVVVVYNYPDKQRYEKYFWNGKTLTFKGGVFPDSMVKITEIDRIEHFEFTPKEDACIVITDDEQVVDTTEFID